MDLVADATTLIIPIAGHCFTRVSTRDTGPGPRACARDIAGAEQYRTTGGDIALRRRQHTVIGYRQCQRYANTGIA